jgi:hypothetical protein
MMNTSSKKASGENVLAPAGHGFVEQMQDIRAWQNRA